MKMIPQWLARLQPQTNRPPVHPTPDAALAMPLLWLGNNDPWTVRDACEGTAVFGATGSGKTSGSGQALAKAFLRSGFGGLVLCAKNDEVHLWQRYCRETNRSNSLIIFGPNQPHRFNFLNYELSRPAPAPATRKTLSGFSPRSWRWRNDSADRVAAIRIFGNGRPNNFCATA